METEKLVYGVCDNNNDALEVHNQCATNKTRSLSFL